MFHLIWNFAGQTSDDYWGIALLILFFLALLVAFMQYSQERTMLKGDASTEHFPEPAISKFFLASEGSAAFWFVVRMYVGAQWLLAGRDKILYRRGTGYLPTPLAHGHLWAISAFFRRKSNRLCVNVS